MSIRHTPITREQQIEGMARSIARLPSDAKRREHIGNITRLHGAEMAQSVRKQAWQFIKAGERPRRVETPAARAGDPGPSHAAADHTTTTGTRHQHQRIVAAAVAMHPGCTSRELTQHCELERHEIARRLPEIVTAGDAYRGEDRICRLGGRSATTWWPTTGASHG